VRLVNDAAVDTVVCGPQPQCVAGHKYSYVAANEGKLHSLVHLQDNGPRD
jgi:hypothetical protein